MESENFGENLARGLYERGPESVRFIIWLIRFYARAHGVIIILLGRYRVTIRIGSCRFHRPILPANASRGSASRNYFDATCPVPPTDVSLIIGEGPTRTDERRAAVRGRRYEIAPVAVARKQGARAKVTLAPSARYRTNELARARASVTANACDTRARVRTRGGNVEKLAGGISVAVASSKILTARARSSRFVLRGVATTFFTIILKSAFTVVIADRKICRGG